MNKEAEKKLIKKMGRQGYAVTEIAQRLGRSTTFVYYHWDKNDPKPYRRMRMREQKAKDLIIKKIIKLRNDGYVFKYIAKEIGLTLATSARMYYKSQAEFNPSNKFIKDVKGLYKRYGVDLHLMTQHTNYSRELVKKVLFNA